MIENADFLVTVDDPEDVTFWATNATFLSESRLHVQGSFWGCSNGLTYEDLKEQVGAAPTSQDLHWPITLSLRSGRRKTRWMSAAGMQARSAKKRARWQR